MLRIFWILFEFSIVLSTGKYKQRRLQGHWPGNLTSAEGKGALWGNSKTRSCLELSGYDHELTLVISKCSLCAMHGSKHITHAISTDLWGWWCYCPILQMEQEPVLKARLPDGGVCTLEHFKHSVCCVFCFLTGFPGSNNGKESACQCRRCKKLGFYP